MQQTKRMILAFTVSIAVFYLWLALASYLWPHKFATTRPATTQPVATQLADLIAATQPATGAASTPGNVTTTSVGEDSPRLRVSGGTSTETITLGSVGRGSPYPMQLVIDPLGAAITEAQIRGHHETVRKDQPYRILTPVARTRGDGIINSFETRKIRFENLKLEVNLDDVVWQLSELTPDSASFSVTVQTSAGRPIARITKTYTLPPQPEAPKKPQTYDLDLTLTVENLTTEPLTTILVQRGPVGFRKEDQRAEDRKIIVANWQNGRLNATGHLRPEIHDKTEIRLGSDEGASRVAWVAETNKYFACIMGPAERVQPNVEPAFSSVEAVELQPSNGSNEERSAVTFEFVTMPQSIAPGASFAVGFDLYVGPKSKKTFQSVQAYDQKDYYWVIKESFYFCAPGGLVSLMMRLLDLFHGIPPHNYGLAIIMLVLVVRGILHPITKKSQINMMKMQKQVATLQPKIDAARAKYSNDRLAQQQAIMEIYQEAGVNPAGSMLNCLPLLLQVPIWGALWMALSSTIEMRHAPFDGFWIKDLAGPDALITFRPVWIPFISHYVLGGPLSSFNLLPILLGISQILQAKYMPRGNVQAQQQTGQPDQLEQQRKVMMFMSGFFVLMLYNAPSGLNLYIMASNLFGILEQWRIRKHIREEEERLAKEPPVTARRRGQGEQPQPSRMQRWLQEKMKELQKQVEEAKKVQSQRDRDRDRGKGPRK